MEGRHWKAEELNFNEEGWPGDVHPIVRQWAQCRGYTEYNDFKDFFSFQLKDLTDPMKLKDMDLAVKRLEVALRKEEKLCIYGDFDMDGTPGLALLLRGLRLCGFQKLHYFQPNRFEHGYGVHAEIIEGFVKECGVDLFLTVDVGITDVAAVEKAKSLGADVIITDHHQQKEILPEALAIVNPNQTACNSGLEFLCGTGVAFYLILALRRHLKTQGLLQKDFDPKCLLDCFAIGTLTDMVPIVKENRALVQHGLLELKKTNRPGIRRLMEELKLDAHFLSGQDVSLRLSPKLNALGRMNSSVNAIDLFLVDDEDQAFDLVKSVMEAHQNRVEIQQKGEEIINSHIDPRQKFNHLFLFSEHFYKGVVGLLATKMVEKYRVPALVGTVIDNKIVGSARAPKGQNILAGLEAASSFLNKFGGHKQAAGFELSLDQAEGFSNELGRYFVDRGGEDSKGTKFFQFSAGLEELNSGLLQWMKQLEPLGQGFEPPVILFENLFVSSLRVLKSLHMKMSLKDVNGRSIDALWFFVEDLDFAKKLKGKRVSLLAEPSRNDYQGKESLQLLIRDLKVIDI